MSANKPRDRKIIQPEQFAFAVTSKSESPAGTDAVAHIPHFRALDGLRGTAVAMVVLFHFWQALSIYQHPLPAGVTRALGLFLIGQKGVDLFFVLSGFLITGILLRTKDSHNYFKTFYIRRALRIFPLYFLVVWSCLLAGKIWHLPQYSWSTTWWYLLYLQNIGKTFWPNAVDGPGHFWSLAVEEHFYLFWPVAVLLLSRYRLMLLCLFLVVAPILIRAAFLQLGLDVFTFTLCRIDTLAMGGLLAILFGSVAGRAAAVKWTRILFAPVAILCFGSFFVLSGSASPLLQTFKYTVFALLCSFILVLSLSPGRYNPAPRFFQVAALRNLGKISYAVYVFHPFVLQLVKGRLFFSAWSPLQGRFYPAVFVELALYLAFTVVAARLSWAIVERPLIALKDHYQYARKEAVAAC